MSKNRKKGSQIIRKKSCKSIRENTPEPITEQCREDTEFLLVSNCPKFHVQKKYGHYLHDSDARVYGSFGVIRKFDAADGSSSMVIKQLPMGRDATFGEEKVIQREQDFLLNVKHENIVRFVETYAALDQYEIDEFPSFSAYQITQYCGDSLLNVIHNGGYEIEDVKRWISELLSALAYLYSANMIPERLNPKKMCIDRTKKLTLLGTSVSRNREIEDSVNFETEPSKRRTMILTWRSKRCSDGILKAMRKGLNIWSVGVILCEMLNGSRLFNARKSVAKQIIKYCGPVDNTVLAKIQDVECREDIARWSIGAKRKNCINLLQRLAKGKPLSWIGIQKTTMSVMNATLHPFLNRMCQLPEDTSSMAAYGFTSKFEQVFWRVRVIGKGGFGCVFYAEKSISGRIIWKRAVKRIALMGRAEEVREAVKEVEAMMSLEVHPGIVRFFDAWTEKPPPGWQPSSDERLFTGHTGKAYTGVMPDYKDNCTYLYIEMELCQSSLSDWLSDNKTRDPKALKQWFKQIVSAVGFIHENKYIHRDLKPCNVLFGRDNQLKICDLGIVTERALNNTQDGEEEPVERTFARGTRMYMAPEQMGWSDYSSKVDIFALGLIFVEMLVAMNTEEAAEIFDNYRNGQPNTVFDDLPESFVAWLTNVDDTERSDCKTILKHSILASI